MVDDIIRRKRIQAQTGWPLHDYPCPQGCYFCRTPGEHKPPCCHGGLCKGQGDTPEARAAKAMAEAIEKRIAQRKVRVGMDRAGKVTLEGLTAEELRYGQANLVVYLSEYGTAATKAEIARAQQMATRTSTTTPSRTTRVIGR